MTASVPPMKVVNTPVRYAPYIGGVEAVAQVVSERLRAGGDDAFVICADDPRGAPPVVNGVPVTRLRTAIKVANTNVTPGLLLALLRSDWDVVHTHLPTPWTADVSVLMAKVLGRKSVLHFHNEVVGGGANNAVAKIYQRTLQRLTMRWADVVFVLSQPWADRLIAQHPGVRGKLHVMPNGVDVARFHPPPPGSPRSADLLFVSVLDAFHEYKGLSVLLAALAALPHARLQVVGDGPKRGHYEQVAQQRGVADRVAFRGAVSDTALEELYRACGVFVLPSQYAAHEGGSSLVVMEAMAAGLPVVVAEGSGDIAWQVERVGAGVRVPAGDVDGLAEALRGLLDDADGRTRLGAAARDHVVAHHSWDARVDDMRAHYPRP